MAVLCGMPSIQYSFQSARLSVHKLFTSCDKAVTWLSHRWCLAACDWVMSALSVVLSTHVRRRRKFGKVSCTECTGQGTDFELIPTVKMETRNHVEGYFGSDFPAICNHCVVMAAWSRKTLNIFEKFLLFWKTTRYGKIFKILFQKFSSRHRSICCVKFGRWENSENLRCLPDQKDSPGSSVFSCRYGLIMPKICQGQPPTMYSAWMCFVSRLIVRLQLLDFLVPVTFVLT